MRTVSRKGQYTRVPDPCDIVRPRVRTTYARLRLRWDRLAASAKPRNPQRSVYLDERPRYEARRLAATSRIFRFTKEIRCPTLLPTTQWQPTLARD